MNQCIQIALDAGLDLLMPMEWLRTMLRAITMLIIN